MSENFVASISVFGRFHAFYLAHELHERNHLHQIITSYPKFEVSKYGVPKEAVTSLLFHEVARRAWNHWLPTAVKPDRVDARKVFADWYDRTAARHIPNDTDLYVGWSSFSEAGLEQAKTNGTTTVLERCSSHIEAQRDLLREEYERYGEHAQLPHSGIIAKEKREYESADYIAVPSSFVERTFIDKGIPKEKLIRVPYGVDLDGFRPVRKEDDTFRVIYAGRMSLRKGVHYLLRAFAELDLPDAELWLIGAKQQEIDPFFQRYGDSFRYLGHKPQNELHRYYSQGSVFAICSIEEGMAYVQAQAMACELPLICTTNTGGGDLVREGEEGFTLPIRDVEAIKKKIRWCYENQDQCREMGRAARRRVTEHFTWSDYGDRITKAYRQILSNDLDCTPLENESNR